MSKSKSFKRWGFDVTYLGKTMNYPCRLQNGARLTIAGKPYRAGGKLVVMCKTTTGDLCTLLVDSLSGAERLNEQFLQEMFIGFVREMAQKMPTKTLQDWLGEIDKIERKEGLDKPPQSS